MTRQSMQSKFHLTAANFFNFTCSVRSLTSKLLTYDKYGDPLEVIRMEEHSLPPLGSREVIVRMLAAPINPSDINTIEGKYPVKVNFPSVPGNEGVGIIEEVGKHVKRLVKGNKVIIVKQGLGTWRTLAIFDSEALIIVPDSLGVAEAATVTVNPCTAYRMLTDFKPVRKRSLTVIQNGANSACGQYVIQLCRNWCIPNVNIVRHRPDIKELKDYLKCLGATYVLTEEELTSTEIFKQKVIERPALALNCVGGDCARQILKHMNHSGSMVTFGGMSKKPIIIPTPVFIFKNLSFFGFWMTAWNKSASRSAKDKMFTELINLMCEGQLRAPVHRMIKFGSYKDVLGKSLSPQGFAGCKYIFDLSST